MKYLKASDAAYRLDKVVYIGKREDTSIILYMEGVDTGFNISFHSIENRDKIYNIWVKQLEEYCNGER